MSDSIISTLVYTSKEETRVLLDRILNQTKFILSYENKSENLNAYFGKLPDIVVIDMALKMNGIEKLITYLKSQNIPYLIIEKEKPLRPLETVIKEKGCAIIGHPIINSKLQEALDYLAKLVLPVTLIMNDHYIAEIHGDGEVSRVSESILEVKSGMSMAMDSTVKIKGKILNLEELSFVRVVRESRYETTSGMFINTLFFPNRKENLVQRVSVLKR